MDLWQALENRRSIRKYKDTPIDKEVLIKLVKAGTLAPNNGNSQPWDFLYVTEKELIEKLTVLLSEEHQKYFGKARVDALEGEILKKVTSKYQKFSNVPAYLIVCMNIRNNQLHSEYQESSYLWCQHSVAAAFENIILAATAEGLGTCWMATPSWGSDKVKELLNIPNDIEIIAVTPIGYPDESPKPRPRLPLEDVVHFNKW